MAKVRNGILVLACFGSLLAVGCSASADRGEKETTNDSSDEFSIATPIATIKLPMCLVAPDPYCKDGTRYTVSGGVVYDTSHANRRWQRSLGPKRTQSSAASYCASLNLGGTTGWCLPTQTELSDIRLHPGGLFGGGSSAHYCIPSIDQYAFPCTPSDLFWTSRVETDGTAWYVGFDDGRTHRDDVSDPLYVRCTHD